MEKQKDFKELLGLLNKHDVSFIIIGAYALAFYGIPRFTGDIDIYVQPEIENANKILAALDEFGFGSLNLHSDDFIKKAQVVQLGVPPVRIDFVTSITGVTWEEADSGKIQGDYDGIHVFYLGREQYIINKKKLGRKKDLADLEALGEA